MNTRSPSTPCITTSCAFTRPYVAPGNDGWRSATLWELEDMVVVLENWETEQRQRQLRSKADHAIVADLRTVFCRFERFPSPRSNHLWTE